MLGADDIKKALAGTDEPPESKPGEDDVDPVTAAGRRLMERRGWTKEDLDDLIAMIEGSRE